MPPMQNKMRLIYIRVILYNIAFITQHNSHNFMFEETGARANFEGLRNTYLYVYIVPVLKYNPR